MVLDANATTYFMTADLGADAIHLFGCGGLSKVTTSFCFFQASMLQVMNFPATAAQPGTGSLIDTLDGRFVNQSTQIGNFLYNANTLGFGGDGTIATPRWYQVNTAASTIDQTGFWFVEDSSHDFNVSLTANEIGEVFTTWTSTDPTVSSENNARVMIGGRQPADPANAMFIGGTAFESPTFYDPTGAAVERWGDYSQTHLDPSVYPNAYVQDLGEENLKLLSASLGKLSLPR